MKGLKQAISALRNDKKDLRQNQVCFDNPHKNKTVNPKYKLLKEDFWKMFLYHSDYILNQHRSDNEGRIKYVTNDYNILLMKYFCKDESFLKDNFFSSQKPSFSKGILVMGDVGVGKSIFFEIIRAMGKELYEKTGSNDLWFKSETAPNIVLDYMNSTKNKQSNFSYEKLKKGKMLIDDLGFEDLAFNKNDFIGKLLFERHREKSITFVTTNLSYDQLIEKYGERVGDRLGEMFNVIKWQGSSLRE